ncbi:hypothetical protein ACP70R_032173 [Stipagrostis hirtigluma subsp. patula]
MGGQDGKHNFLNSPNSNISTGQGSIAGDHAVSHQGYPHQQHGYPPVPGPYGYAPLPNPYWCPPPPGAYGYAYGYGYAPPVGPYSYPPQHRHGHQPGGYPLAQHQGDGGKHGRGPPAAYGEYDHFRGHGGGYGGYGHGYGGHYGKFSYGHSRRGKFEQGKFKHEHGKFSGKYTKTQDPNCEPVKCE